jgi:hypothetical protein
MRRARDGFPVVLHDGNVVAAVLTGNCWICAVKLEVAMPVRIRLDGGITPARFMRGVFASV